MNKTYVHNTLWLLTFFFLLSSLSVSAGKLEYKKKKEINKSFKVSLSDLLYVDNKYGNITITPWNKNEVEIKVIIESASRSEKKAQEYLDRVQIDLNKQGNTVSASTTIQNTSISNNENVRFTVNYFIQMPSKLSCELTQKYGNITLPQENEGIRKIHVKYGNLMAGNFHADLELEAKYGNIDIENVTVAHMDLGYISNLKMKDGKELYIDSKYSDLTIQNVKRIELEKKYGNIKLGTVEKAYMELRYSDATIDNLTQEIEVDALSYGTLDIRKLSGSFSRVEVDSHYGNLKIAIPEKTAFNLEAENMKYGHYQINGFNITHLKKEDKEYYQMEINGGGNRKIYYNGNKYGNIDIKSY